MKHKIDLQPVLNSFDRYLLGTIVAVYIGFRDAYDDRWFKVIGIDITKGEGRHRVLYRLQAIGKNNTVIGITVNTDQEEPACCLTRDELQLRCDNMYLSDTIKDLFPNEYQRLCDKYQQVVHLLSIYPDEEPTLGDFKEE